MLLSGDSPASAKMMGMRGHTAKFHCRYCLIEGVTLGDGSSTQYFPLIYPCNRPDCERSVRDYNINQIIDPNGKYARTPELMQKTYDKITESSKLPGTTPAQLETLRKATGVNYAPIITKLPTIIPPRSFPLDFMHLVILNIFRRMFTHWTGRFPHTPPVTCIYRISDATWKKIGSTTASNRQHMPLSFGSPYRDIYKHWKGFKAEEWKNWMLRLSIPLLQDHLPNQYFVPWKSFILAVKKLSDPSPKTQADLDDIEKSFKAFYRHYEK